MWREVLSTKWPEVEFSPPCSLANVESVEASLGMPLPDELRALYFETDGVYSTRAYMWIVWCINDVLKRTHYMHTSPDIAFYEKSFNELLFFGDLGNGDLLAFQTDSTLQSYQSVGIWDHETGEYLESAKSMQEMIDKNLL